jgi:parallel beta-helix repeat protein
MSQAIRFLWFGFLYFCIAILSPVLGDDGSDTDFSPPPAEKQLPLKMHSQMDELPTIRVGMGAEDVLGRDNRVLQAAVDYIAALGGGTVEIGPGEYLMRDSLHLRSHVVVKGTPGETVLKKAEAVVSALALDGDFGEQQFTVENADGFEVGRGVAIWDNQSGGFHTTVARITGRRANTFSIDKPLMSDCMVSQDAKAGTLFPVVSGYDLEGAEVRDLIIEGNKQANDYLNGCRGGGIFLYRAFGTTIQGCTVRNYHGDGISFQQSNDVTVDQCTVQGNTQLGLHPGSGSQRPTVRNCTARDNGTDGLFLCWRVRHGLFEDNLLENNGRFGISIGHKDSDNLLRQNIVRGNRSHGVLFRDESLGMAAHRNRLVDNTIENNGASKGTAGIRVEGATNGLVFQGNTVRDTRQADDQTQTIGVMLDDQVGQVTLAGNRIEAERTVEDRRTGDRQVQEATSESPR